MKKLYFFLILLLLACSNNDNNTSQDKNDKSGWEEIGEITAFCYAPPMGSWNSYYKGPKMEKVDNNFQKGILYVKNISGNLFYNIKIRGESYSVMPNTNPDINCNAYFTYDVTFQTNYYFNVPQW